MKEKVHWEIADEGSPEDIARAVQASLLTAMIGVIDDLKKNTTIKSPGLTWEQIDYFLKSWRDKSAKIVRQAKENEIQ